MCRIDHLSKDHARDYTETNISPWVQTPEHPGFFPPKHEQKWSNMAAGHVVSPVLTPWVRLWIRDLAFGRPRSVVRAPWSAGSRTTSLVIPGGTSGARRGPGTSSVEAGRTASVETASLGGLRAPQVFFVGKRPTCYPSHSCGTMAPWHQKEGSPTWGLKGAKS